MNILRWHRKSKKKIRLKTIVLFIFSLIMTTFAWFAYSKVLNTNLDIHISAWDMAYYIGGAKKENPIGIEIPTLYPAMPEQTVTIDIENNGERLVDIDYYLESVTIAGETYTLVQEGQTKPEGKHIVLTQSYLETDVATGKQIVKGAITNDITKLPFTIEVEHSAQVEPKTIDEDGNETGGEGYLAVRVNWSGDNDLLDSEWGYIVGQYLMDKPEGTAVISISLSIDSYQVEEETEEIVTMPSTSETKPYLPTGFTRVAGTTLDTGLVIKDASGNQYVWVEVPKNATVYGQAGLNITGFSDTECALIETDLKVYSAAYRTREDTYTSNRAIGIADEDEYTTLKNNVLKSIYQNGGFYIGRYETGIEGAYRTNYVTTTAQTPVIKANAYPYNFVSCSQAQSLATSMSSGQYTSSLMFGLQWDLVLKYLETKGSESSELHTDSTQLGNYYKNEYYVLNAKSKYLLDTGATNWSSVEWGIPPYEKNTQSAITLTTGANSQFSKQNIYDLAGNVSEWTFNISSADNTGGNGGDYSDTTNNVANYCSNYDATSGVKQVGFRVTIY